MVAEVPTGDSCTGFAPEFSAKKSAQSPSGFSDLFV